MPGRYSDDEGPEYDEGEDEQQGGEEQGGQDPCDDDEGQVEWAYSTCEGTKKAVLVRLLFLVPKRALTLIPPLAVLGRHKIRWKCVPFGRMS